MPVSGLSGVVAISGGGSHSLALKSDGTASAIAHEYRHAYQNERAWNPVTELDHRFRENVDNYIPAGRDYEAYQDQLIESDARDYAQQFKDLLSSL